MKILEKIKKAKLIFDMYFEYFGINEKFGVIRIVKTEDFNCIYLTYYKPPKFYFHCYTSEGEIFNFLEKDDFDALISSMPKEYGDENLIKKYKDKIIKLTEELYDRINQ